MSFVNQPRAAAPTSPFPRPCRWLAVACLPLLAGCGRSADSSADSDTKRPAPAAGSDFKVALITHRAGQRQRSWNADAFKALQAVKTDTGADAQNVEAKTPGEPAGEPSRLCGQKIQCRFRAWRRIRRHGPRDCKRIFPPRSSLFRRAANPPRTSRRLVLRMEDGAYLMGIACREHEQDGQNRLCRGAENPFAGSDVFSVCGGSQSRETRNHRDSPNIHRRLGRRGEGQSAGAGAH